MHADGLRNLCGQSLRINGLNHEALVAARRKDKANADRFSVHVKDLFRIHPDLNLRNRIVPESVSGYSDRVRHGSVVCWTDDIEGEGRHTEEAVRFLYSEKIANHDPSIVDGRRAGDQGYLYGKAL